MHGLMSRDAAQLTAHMLDAVERAHLGPNLDAIERVLENWRDQLRAPKGTGIGGQWIRSLIFGGDAPSSAAEKLSAGRDPDVRRALHHIRTAGGSTVSYRTRPRPAKPDDRVQDPNNPRRMGTVLTLHPSDEDIRRNRTDLLTEMRVRWDDGTTEVRPRDSVFDPFREPARSYDAEPMPRPAKMDPDGPPRQLTVEEKVADAAASGKVSGRTAADLLRRARGEKPAPREDFDPEGVGRLLRAISEPDEGGAAPVKAPREKGTRRVAPWDPFPVYIDNGEPVLRERLSELDLEQLRDIVADHGMDRAGLAMKWKDRDRLVELIVERVRDRSTKGHAFRPPVKAVGEGSRKAAAKKAAPTRTELAAQLAAEPGLHPLAARNIRESKGNAKALRATADAHDAMATAIEHNPDLGDPALGLTPKGYREMARQLRNAADRIDAQTSPPREKRTFPDRPDLTSAQRVQRRVDAGFSSQPTADDVDAALSRLTRPELVELSDRLNISEDGRVWKTAGRGESISSWPSDRLTRLIREEALGQSLRTTGSIDDGAADVVDVSLDIKPSAAPSPFPGPRKAPAPRKAAPSLTGEEGLASDPAVREVQVENRIRAAVGMLQRERGGWVSLADLRDHELIRELGRGEVDAGFKRLAGKQQEDGGAVVIPESEQTHMAPQLRDAAVKLGSQMKHFIAIDDSSPRPLPTSAGGPQKAAKPAAAAKLAAGKRLTAGQVDTLSILDRKGGSVEASFLADPNPKSRTSVALAALERNGLVARDGDRLVLTDAGRAALTVQPAAFDADDRANRIVGMSSAADIETALSDVTSTRDLRKVATAVSLPLPKSVRTAPEIRAYIAERVFGDRTRWALPGTDPRLASAASPSASKMVRGRAAKAPATNGRTPVHQLSPDERRTEIVDTAERIMSLQTADEIRAEIAHFTTLPPLKRLAVELNLFLSGTDVPRTFRTAAELRDYIAERAIADRGRFHWR